MNATRGRLLRESVRREYSAAAEDPLGEYRFPLGFRFAHSLGYPQSLLGALPPASTEAFTGVSNLSINANISLNDTVLDLGCGAGLDSLIAARRTGSGGRVFGFDFSWTMLHRARRAVVQSGAVNVFLVGADAERLPLKSGSIDVALVNGIFNLNPDRATIFLELFKVLRAGGLVYAAELILREPLPRRLQEDEANWFA